MRTRFLLIGAVAAGLTFYAWQFISHTFVPWHDNAVGAFTNDSAVVEVIRANAPDNGVYFSPAGVLAVADFAPGGTDQTQALGAELAIQLVLNIVLMLVLALVVLRLPSGSAILHGVTLATIALAASIATRVSDWNWYGYSASFAIVNTIDLMIGGSSRASCWRSFARERRRRAMRRP